MLRVQVEIRAFGVSSKHPTNQYYTKVLRDGDEAERRNSCSFMAPKTRALEEKLAQVL